MQRACTKKKGEVDPATWLVLAKATQLLYKEFEPLDDNFTTLQTAQERREKEGGSKKRLKI